MERRYLPPPVLARAGEICSMMLMALFAVLSVLLIAIGMQAYSAITDCAARNAQARDSVNYVVNKVRASDGQARLGVTKTDGVTVLTLTQDFDGDPYETRIYCSDGYLMESFSRAQSELDPEGGEVISHVSAFTAVPGESWQFIITDLQGEEHIQYYTPRCAQE